MAKDTWIDKCYLTSDGTMAKSTWIGSEYVGSDGVKTGETRSPGLFTDKDGKTYLLDSSYQPVTGAASGHTTDTTFSEFTRLPNPIFTNAATNDRPYSMFWICSRTFSISVFRLMARLEV